MFTWIHQQLGGLFWPTMGIFAGVIIVKTLMALLIDFQNRLKLAFLAGFLFVSAALAETTVAPADVTAPLGEWGQDSSILSEVKMARDEARMTNCLLAMIIGGQWLAAAVRNVRP